jgi:hypothetical protein
MSTYIEKQVSVFVLNICIFGQFYNTELAKSCGEEQHDVQSTYKDMQLFQKHFSQTFRYPNVYFFNFSVWLHHNDLSIYWEKSACLDCNQGDQMSL